MASKQTTPIIVADSREQLPYAFPESWPVIRKALPSADYSLLGQEDVFAIERKSLSDLAGCIFTDRFKAELERLSSFKHAFLAIESSLYKIRNHMPRHSKVHPASLVGFLQSIPLLYGVHVLYLEDRETAQEYVKGLLEKYNRFLLNDRKDTP